MEEAKARLFERLRDLNQPGMEADLKVVVGEGKVGRPLWIETWLAVAQTYAKRSTCPRGSTGAVLVTIDNQQLAAGYNGAPRGLPHCSEVGCRMEAGHCVRAMHAEANALMQAARLGIRVEGSHLYCTHRPCQRCTMLLIQAGISGIWWLEEYHSDDVTVAQAMAIRAGVAWGRLPTP